MQTWSRYLLPVASAFVLVPIIGEYFVVLAKEAGLYEQPTARVWAALSLFLAIADIPGFKLCAGFVLGLSCGMRLDALRRRGQQFDIAEPRLPNQRSRKLTAAHQTIIDIISWNFDDPDKNTYFLGMSCSSNTDILVSSFQAEGRNNSSKSIKNAKGIIRSNITNRELPIYFVFKGLLVRPEDTYGIPPNSTFQISSAPFQVNDNDVIGIIEEEFIANYASMTFEFESEEYKYSRVFTRDEIKACFEMFKNAVEPHKSDMPRVTVRPGSEPVMLHSIRYE